jgi:hypothetical protein
MMNTQAKVTIDKQKHPERFCPVNRCLWRTSKLDHATQTYSVHSDCPGGYCPRHRHGAGNRLDVLEPIRRAACAEGFFFAALRAHGVFDPA